MGEDDGAIVERVRAGDLQEAWLHAFLELGQLRRRDRFVAWLLDDASHPPPGVHAADRARALDHRCVVRRTI